MHVMLLPLNSESSNMLVIRADGPRFLIGRANECQLQLANAVVSRRHCELLIGDDGVFVRDLQSKHGTFVNGQRISHMASLRNGDTLHVASSAFEVGIPEQPPGTMTNYKLPTRAHIAF